MYMNISIIAVLFPLFIFISSFILVLLGVSTNVKMFILSVEFILYIRLVYLMFVLKENPKTKGYVNGHKIIRRRNWNRELVLSPYYDPSHVADVTDKGCVEHLKRLGKTIITGKC